MDISRKLTSSKKRQIEPDRETQKTEYFRKVNFINIGKSLDSQMYPNRIGKSLGTLRIAVDLQLLSHFATTCRTIA